MTLNKDASLDVFSISHNYPLTYDKHKVINTCRLLLHCNKEPLSDPPQETMSIAFISHMNYGTFSAELM